MNPAIDERHMRRCLELARKSEGRTSPNPAVGCVIVDRRGRVVAEGWHRGPGSLHGETDALAKLGGRASGYTLYCNLEPCHHRRNRTRRPCSEHLAEAGIGRLVIGMGDPIRSHAGGARFLQKQGIEVIRNVLRAECVELNRPFITAAKHGRAMTVLKAAMSLDGKIATRTGESQWITGARARKHGHGLRNRLDAIMVGIGTVLADDPRLTVRGVRGGRDPVRVVVDSRLRTPPDASLLPANSDSRARVIIATGRDAARTRERRLQAAGADIWRIAGLSDDNESRRAARRPIDLSELLQALAADGLNSVLVEGGAGIHGALLDADLVDDLFLYIAPKVIGGGAHSPSWAGGVGALELAAARGFRVQEPVQMLGSDLLVRARRR